MRKNNVVTWVKTGGPYGDETSTYKVILSKDLTLKEFVDLVLDDEREWGNFEIGDKKGYLIRYIGYTHGEIKNTEKGKWAEEYYDDTPLGDLGNFLVEKEIFAHGGWTNMNYSIKLKN